MQTRLVDRPIEARRRKRYTDALLGCAVGDCLGIPYENRGIVPPASWAAEAHPAPVPSWTDDTQQSLVLLDDVIRHGHLDAKRVMDRFVRMCNAEVADRARFGLHRGTGRGFRHAVREYQRTGKFSPLAGRAGNGAAMRVVAVSIALGESDASRNELVAVASATHGEAVAIDAAMAVAEAAWALEAGQRGRELLARVRDRVPEGEVRRVFAQLLACEQADHENLARITGWGAGNGHALGSPLGAIVLAAFAASLHDALRRAVWLGGDTDSTAAIAGALVASVEGLDGLPRGLLKIPGIEVLRRWGDEIPPSEQEWLDLEHSLCKRLPG